MKVFLGSSYIIQPSIPLPSFYHLWSAEVIISLKSAPFTLAHIYRNLYPLTPSPSAPPKNVEAKQFFPYNIKNHKYCIKFILPWLCQILVKPGLIAPVKVNKELRKLFWKCCCQFDIEKTEISMKVRKANCFTFHLFIKFWGRADLFEIWYVRNIICSRHL